jgi:hypothetical protein
MLPNMEEMKGDIFVYDLMVGRNLPECPRIKGYIHFLKKVTI